MDYLPKVKTIPFSHEDRYPFDTNNIQGISEMNNLSLVWNVKMANDKIL